MKITPKGFRSDLDQMFKLNGVMIDGSKHSNIMSLQIIKDEIVISVHQNMEELLYMPPETTVIVRWPGNWSSDVFLFKLSDWK